MITLGWAWASIGAMVAPVIMTGESVAPLPVERTWQGTDDCRPAAFDRALRVNLTQTPEEIRRDTTANIHVERRGDELELRLELHRHGKSVARTFSSPACDVVSDAAAFSVAIAVDPEILDRWESAPTRSDSDEEPQPPPPVEASPTLRSEPTEPPQLTEPAKPAEPAEPIPTRRWWGTVRIGGGIDGVALPGVGALIGARVGIAGPWLRVDVTGQYRLGTDTMLTDRPDVGARLSQWAMGLRACAVVRPGRWSFPACAGLEAGQVMARGVGFEQARESRPLWLAAVPGLGLAFFPWWHAGFFAHAEVPIVLRSQRFSIDEVGVVHQLAAVAVRGLAGIEVRF